MRQKYKTIRKSYGFDAAATKALNKRMDEPAGCILDGELTEEGQRYYSKEIQATQRLLKKLRPNR